MQRVTNPAEVKAAFQAASKMFNVEIKYGTAYRMSTGEVAFLKGFMVGAKVRQFLLQSEAGSWYRASLNFILDK